MTAVASAVAFRRFAERAAADDKLELEIGLDAPITLPMFRRLLQVLERDVPGSFQETLQLDVLKETTRMEYHGRALIERLIDVTRNGTSQAIPPTRVLVKRREMSPISHEDFEYTVRLKRELDVTGEAGTKEFEMRAFRLKRRFSCVFGNCRIDCTAVQEKRKSDGVDQKHRPVTFEVEVEYIGNKQIGPKQCDPDEIVGEMSAIAVRCLGIMRGTSSPVPKADRETLLWYLRQSHVSLGGDPDQGGPRFQGLLGSQPVTLELSHLKRGDQGIWDQAYTVTDKADGVRCQLVVVCHRAYTMDALTAVRLVGTRVPAGANGAILDGELITASKDGTPINLFAAFDIYGVAGRSLVTLPLIGPSSRQTELVRVVSEISRADLIDGFRAVAKTYMALGGGDSPIARTLATSKQYPYSTDGLIFTPANLAVGARFDGDCARVAGVWHKALKWKPPESNTIDFLVRPCPEFASETTPISIPAPRGTSSECGMCKVFRVHASYIPRKWERLDVTRYFLFGERAFPSFEAEARPFEAAGAPDEARVYVGVDSCGMAVCEDGSIVDDDTIVECAYRVRDGVGAWSPLRTRPDKMDRFARSGIAGAANDWGTALNVWRSITHPVTLEALSSGPSVPEESVVDTPPGTADASAYYAARTFEPTRSILHNMTTFHNTVVKAWLFDEAVRLCSAAGNPSLFEMACGKGGDVPRWLAGSFDPIVGIDKSMDNIVNSMDGVYARVDKTKGMRDSTFAFVCMDASTRMRPPLDEVRVAAAESPHGDVIAALWDTAGRAMTDTSLSPIRGLLTRGFDVVSCQFAIHYLFENDMVLDRFVRNVDFLLRPGGVFVATCLDGDKVADLLDRSPQGNMRGTTTGGCLAWSIQKRYQGNFAGGTGFAIDVFVETIHQVTREYLVSPAVLASRFQSIGVNLVRSRPFPDLFASLPRGLAMTDLEKKLSSLNTAFVFRCDPVSGGSAQVGARHVRVRPRDDLAGDLQ